MTWCSMTLQRGCDLLVNNMATPDCERKGTGIFWDYYRMSSAIIQTHLIPSSLNDPAMLYKFSVIQLHSVENLCNK